VKDGAKDDATNSAKDETRRLLRLFCFCMTYGDERRETMNVFSKVVFSKVVLASSRV
jgi:hypothetical protein